MSAARLVAPGLTRSKRATEASSMRASGLQRRDPGLPRAFGDEREAWDPSPALRRSDVMAHEGVAAGAQTLLGASTLQLEGPKRALVGPRAGHDFRAIAVTPLHAVPGAGKAEPAMDDDGPQDQSVKVEVQGSTVAGGVTGGIIGAVIGGAVGGPLGLVAGLVIGGGLGALIGHFAGSGSTPAAPAAPAPAPAAPAAGGITWDAASYSAVAAGGASTTLETPFVPTYKASANAAKNVWDLQVSSMRGGATIVVHLGGSRNPITSPPTTEAEAKAAVDDMKGYYARGNRGSWHTEAASKAHEEHHVREWKCSSDHYWPVAKTAIEKLTLPMPSAANENDAVTAMRAGPSGADALAQQFHDVSRKYWFTLSDGASSRPFAAGQAVLNTAIRSVQTLAASKSWSVAAGTDSPSAEPPCYQPYLPFTP